MLHYHGTPITPLDALYQLAGRCFCVSHIRPDDVRRVHDIGQSVMLDNGAFSAWKAGVATDWPGYYAWCDRWLDYPTTWAIPPDVIDAPSQEQDGLLNEWPHGRRQAAPVWHMDEPLGRLCRLVDDGWSRVCVGSTAQLRARHRSICYAACNAAGCAGRSPRWTARTSRRTTTGRRTRPALWPIAGIRCSLQHAGRCASGNNWNWPHDARGHLSAGLVAADRVGGGRRHHARAGRLSRVVEFTPSHAGGVPRGAHRASAEMPDSMGRTLQHAPRPGRPRGMSWRALRRLPRPSGPW